MEQKNFSTEIRNYPRDYLKVFVADQNDIPPLKTLVNSLTTVRWCNDTPSQSIEHNGLTLTIYGKPMFDISVVETEVVNALNAYYAPRTTIINEIVTKASFAGIEALIIEEISKAQTSIIVCMAWFTNERIRCALEERIQSNVEIRILVYDDCVNSNHGVDLSAFSHHKIKASRGGIMHRKYCVIDNHRIITGSYNWSDNAEFRNDENVIIVQDWQTANECTKEFNKIWYDVEKNNESDV